MKLNSDIQIAGRYILERQCPYIIGEIACSHQGDYLDVFKLIDAVVRLRCRLRSTPNL